SSCTSTLRRARVTAAIPKATEVSSTSPSGTMPMTPATTSVIALSMSRLPRKRHSNSPETGNSAYCTIRRMRLMPSINSEQVRVDDLFGRYVDTLAVPHHARRRGDHDRQLVQLPLRADLLEDADRGVRDQHHAERRVLDLAEDEDDGEHHAEDGVETREDVRPQDLAVGTAGLFLRLVGQAASDALLHLPRGETGWRRFEPAGVRLRLVSQRG